LPNGNKDEKPTKELGQRQEKSQQILPKRRYALRGRGSERERVRERKRD